MKQKNNVREQIKKINCIFIKILIYWNFTKKKKEKMKLAFIYKNKVFLKVFLKRNLFFLNKKITFTIKKVLLLDKKKNN